MDKETFIPIPKQLTSNLGSSKIGNVVKTVLHQENKVKIVESTSENLEIIPFSIEMDSKGYQYKY